MGRGAQVFGLRVTGVEHLPQSVQYARPESPGPLRARSLRLDVAEWGNDPAPVRWRSGPQGGGFIVSERPSGEWVLELEGVGRALLAGDGTTAQLVGDQGDLRWPWFVLNQVVGFAATLQGLEVLHASAVAIDGRAIAITAPSGVGKSTLATALMRLGARPVTDDVLAVEGDGTRLMSHPGPVAGAAATPSPHRVALTHLVLLERVASGSVTAIPEKLTLETLLGTTRNAVVASENRLVALMELYVVARGALEVLRVRTSDSEGPAETAHVLWGCLGLEGS